MPILLADTNALRDPGLDTYLEASRDYHIALSDLTLIEMRKSNAILTSRQSLQIASKYPGQFFVLKRTHALLEIVASTAREAGFLIDHAAGLDLENMIADLALLPLPQRLRDHMAELEAEAVYFVTELGRQVAEFEDGLVSTAAEFRPDQIRQLRTGTDVSDETRQTLFRLLKETTAHFFVCNQITPGRRGIQLSSARNMFAFRYSLCMMIYYILWVQKGRQTGLKTHLRVNDVVDMQQAALNTFFDGILSRDDLVLKTSRGARAILRAYGAYVPSDWLPPASLLSTQEH